LPTNAVDRSCTDPNFKDIMSNKIKQSYKKKKTHQQFTTAKQRGSWETELKRQGVGRGHSLILAFDMKI